MTQTLDFSLRCNTLTCRTILNDRAVVTTCSHIFCLTCAESLGLSRPTAQTRSCPACQTNLPNPDDAVSTILNPSEDYKTSVMSGLDPTTIMECAGRALSFWAYQTTQEICYQEYLNKSLTDKYRSLNTDLEKVISSADTEISTLQSKLTEAQLAQDQVQKKNEELITMYQEKCKKHTQMINLYNLLKSRAMRSQIQTAASDSVSQALKSLPRTSNTRVPMNGIDYLTGNDSRPIVSQTTRVTSRHFNALTSPETFTSGAEQLFKHQRSGGASSRKSRSGLGIDIEGMPPPKLPFSVPQPSIPTPDHHRTRLPAPPREAFVHGGQHHVEKASSTLDFGRFKDFTFKPG
ncbi:hypothetical protein BGW36DRAFT_397885 [Talaromyces proteolyticus]|uniref:RING-type domain-containing protein n=1 Tax=Talaromyces proteolyticus TaxID=1131652 RepID=A0AAD4PZE2_9EURO|nr:uncharacterized protein BGW36DRAFT_397885 [Talaromyces proteolyticus]KAH8696307.1 hypothetical protein BGW36DRAFT_397885 [Talaromyces proteolyticus]